MSVRRTKRVQNLINHYCRHYAGDDTWNNVTQEALLFQVGPNQNYEPVNQSRTEVCGSKGHTRRGTKRHRVTTTKPFGLLPPSPQPNSNFLIHHRTNLLGLPSLKRSSIDKLHAGTTSTATAVFAGSSTRSTMAGPTKTPFRTGASSSSQPVLLAIPKTKRMLSGPGRRTIGFGRRNSSTRRRGRFTIRTTSMSRLESVLLVALDSSSGVTTSGR